MKINYPLISRSLIALLFVVAGVGKIMGFADTTQTISSLGVPLPMLAAIITIIIEVPVALAYAWGYRVCYTGGALIVFTLLTTVIIHRDITNSVNMIMALKNLAIIGGILATTGVCSCDRCTVLNPKHSKQD